MKFQHLVILAGLAVLPASRAAGASASFDIDGFGLETDVHSLRDAFPRSEHNFVKGTFRNIVERYDTFDPSDAPEDRYRLFVGREYGTLPETLTGSYSLSFIRYEQESAIRSLRFALENNVIQRVDLDLDEPCEDMKESLMKPLGQPQETKTYFQETLPHASHRWKTEFMTVELDCMAKSTAYFADRITLWRIPEKRSIESQNAREFKDFVGKCVNVIEGDTIEVMDEGKVQRVRLYAVDCPERGQPFYAKSREFVESLVLGQEVSVAAIDMDIYGRTVGRVLLEDGRTLNDELVFAGLAWVLKLEGKREPELRRLEAEARKYKRGLWADKKRVAPWDYRRLKGKKSEESWETAPPSILTPNQ